MWFHKGENREACGDFVVQIVVRYMVVTLWPAMEMEGSIGSCGTLYFAQETRPYMEVGVCCGFVCMDL